MSIGSEHEHSIGSLEYGFDCVLLENWILVWDMGVRCVEGSMDVIAMRRYLRSVPLLYVNKNNLELKDRCSSRL